jgi:hypothetical protein
MYSSSMLTLVPLALLASLVTRSSALAQQPEPEPVPVPAQEPQPGAAQDEMRELFLKVERNLLRMDQYLLDASAGDTSKLDTVEGAGIDDLLDQSSVAAAGVGASGVAKVLGVTRKRGDRVLEDIDRILELAKKNGQSCSSGGGSPKPGDSQSPSPTEGQQNNQTQRMQGNKAPGKGEPEEPGQEPDQGQDPKGNRDSKDPPSSNQVQHMPNHPTNAPPPVTQDADRWGELPIYARDLFRAEGGHDLPPQYRDWIDAYYRRLNRRAGGN